LEESEMKIMCPICGEVTVYCPVCGGEKFEPYYHPKYVGGDDTVKSEKSVQCAKRSCKYVVSKYKECECGTMLKIKC